MITTVLFVLMFAVLACVAGVLVVVVPFVVAVDMAERRGFATSRTGTATLLLMLAGLGLGYAAVQGRYWLLLLPAVALAWSGPGILTMMDASQTRVAGALGAHQR